MDDVWTIIIIIACTSLMWFLNTLGCDHYKTIFIPGSVPQPYIVCLDDEEL